MYRDGYQCQGKKNCKAKILKVHHIESRKTGGNSPDNLITLCDDCHEDCHCGKIKLNVKRGKSFRAASFMGIMRWGFYSELKELYPDVSLTYGYITKNTRITEGLPKTHSIDAYCVANNLKAKRSEVQYIQKFVRKNNRSLHKANLLKGGRRKANKVPYLVRGFRLFDKVLFDNMECFIFGRRSSGYFDLRLLDGTKVHASASFKKLTLLEKVSTLLTERRNAFLPNL